MLTDSIDLSEDKLTPEEAPIEEMDKVEEMETEETSLEETEEEEAPVENEEVPETDAEEASIEDEAEEEASFEDESETPSDEPEEEPSEETAEELEETAEEAQEDEEIFEEESFAEDEESFEETEEEIPEGFPEENEENEEAEAFNEDEEDFIGIFEDETEEAPEETIEEAAPCSEAEEENEKNILRLATEEEKAEFEAEISEPEEETPIETKEEPVPAIPIPAEKAEEVFEKAEKKEKKAKKEKKEKKPVPSEPGKEKTPPPAVKKDGFLRDVFLLYCAADRPLAQKLTLLLENNGISCAFLDRDLPRNTLRYDETVKKALSLCRTVIVITSKNTAYRPKVYEALEWAHSARKRILHFEREAAPMPESASELLSSCPTIRPKGFRPERFVLTVNALLKAAAEKKAPKGAEKLLKTKKKRVKDLNRIYRSARNALGARVLVLFVFVYLGLTALSFLPEFGYADFLYTQFPSAKSVTDAHAPAYAAVFRILPFSVSEAALTAGLLSLGFTLLSLPFSRYSVRRASGWFLFLNFAVTGLILYSLFLLTHDIPRLVLSVSPLIVSLILLLLIRKIASRMSALRK